MDRTLSDTVFLQLLARDAPAEEYDEPLRAAVAAGAGQAELDALEAAKALALQVRRVLEHRRRREVELEALFETAGDLAALQGVDAVLDAIVRRARTLLHTDVAYLTLIDAERGDTYMRATAGVVSASFRRVRLAMGTGLGGLVAGTSTPYATDDYPADERFRHVAAIDGAVDDEGLVAILGVPLLLGPQVLGVLFAADRTKRSFGRDEISLLSSLAAHAAIAIDGARLLEETRAAVRELNAANTLVRRHSAAVERAAEAHDRFTGLVLRGGSIDDVAAAVTDVLGGGLQVLDADGRCVASAGDERPDRLPRGWADAVAASRGQGRAVCRDGTWYAAVVAGAEHFGALVLHGRADLDEADQRVLERAALVTALLHLMIRTATETENRIRGELVADLVVHGAAAGIGHRERARQLGLDLDAGFAVAVVQTDRERLRRLSFAANHEASLTGGIAGVHPGARSRPPGDGRSRRSGHRFGGRPRCARRGVPLPGRPGRARPRGGGHQQPRARLRRSAPRRAGRRAELRAPRARAGPGVRRPPRHRPGPHPGGVLRARRQPEPCQGRPARARQHRRATAGPGVPAARERVAATRTRAGDPAGAATPTPAAGLSRTQGTGRRGPRTGTRTTPPYNHDP